MKSGDIIYMRVEMMDRLYVNAYKAQIIKVNKKHGEDYSVRVNLLQRFSVKDGVEDAGGATVTWRLDGSFYTFFTNYNAFAQDLEDSILNIKKVADIAINEIPLLKPK